MAHKKGKPKSKKKFNYTASQGKSPKHGIIESLTGSGWIQNISAAIIVIGTAIVCAIMKMSVLKTSVITACVLLTALVWIGGVTIIRAYDRADDNPPFKADIDFSFVSTHRDATQIGAIPYSHLITPVPVLLKVRLANRQSVPATISNFSIDIELRKGSWILPSKWMRTKPIPELMPLVWRNPPPTPGMTLTLDGERLESRLSKGALAPNETIRGWVLLDVPPEYESVPQP